MLFLWVLPYQVSDGINLLDKSDFKYSTCLLWQRDKKNEISTLGELCLIGIRGNPKIIFKNFQGVIDKPALFKEIIDRGYPGLSRVELKIGEGWEIW